MLPGLFFAASRNRGGGGLHPLFSKICPMHQSGELACRGFFLGKKATPPSLRKADVAHFLVVATN